MKDIWQTEKFSPIARRVLTMALCLCMLVSMVQNVAFKGVSAEETTSGSDIAAEEQINEIKEEAVKTSESDKQPETGDIAEDTNEVSESDRSIDIVKSNIESDTDIILSDTDISATDTPTDAETETEYGKPQIVMTTELEIGDSMYLDISADDTVYVDWGDGNIVEYSQDGVTAGSEIRIYCDGSITEFECSNNQLTELDVSSSPELIYLSCGYNKISRLDVANNTKLIAILCLDNQLTEINLPNDSLIERISCENNKLKELDVSTQVNLMELFCDNNELNELSLANNKRLFMLGCNNNNLTELDLRNFDFVGGSYLDCSGNKITKLNFKQGDKRIIECFCYDNQLTELDLSGFKSIGYLVCYNNNIENLYIDNDCKIIGAYDIKNNALCFSDLSGKIAQIAYYDHGYYYYGYAPQARVEIKSSVEANKELDLSNEAIVLRNELTSGTDIIIEGKQEKTVFTWYNAADDSVVTPTTSANGVFTFGEDFIGESLYCTMTNSIFPDLTLTTTSAEITAASDEENPVVSDGDITVEDENDYVGDVEVEDDTTFEDEDGNEVGLGKLHLIIGNVAENSKKTVLEAVEAYNNEFNADDNNYALYEIHLETDKGVKVTEIDGRILICLKYPDNLGAECTDYTYNLYHQKSDGTIEEMEITCKPNGIWFYADDFSPFVLTWELKETEVKGESDSATPDTGDHSNNTFVFAIMANCLVLIVAYGINAVLTYNKKRKTEK